MSKVTHTVECECVGRCTILKLDLYREDGSVPDEWWAEFYSSGGDTTLRHRIAQAWRLLRRKRPFVEGVSLTDAQLARLRDFLQEHVK